MANYSIPGPLNLEEHSPLVDEGTMCRAVSPTPGSVAAPRKPPPLHTVEDLFRMCFVPLGVESPKELAVAAETLGVEIAAIQAVAAVETENEAGNTRIYLGRPSILFERHHFNRHTGGAFDQFPDISNRDSGGFGAYSSQYEKLERAHALHPDAALKSASWGKYQILGSNFQEAGYSSVRAFVEAMISSPSAQLAAFVKFVQAHPLMLNALKDKDWPTFARLYNGREYKKSQYDTRIEKKYTEFVNKAGAVGADSKP